jgi:hypothetical protein
MNAKAFQIPENPHIFFAWLKKMSERVWANVEAVEGVFGFQTQKETKWLEGLTEEEINEYESELGFTFPEIYKFFLSYMNGTDKPAVNYCGYSGTAAYASNYYSFPKDLEIVKDKIKWIYEEFTVGEEDIRREKIPHIIPIVGHRFLIADNCAETPVLSIHGRDAVLYAPSLQSFLIADIFEKDSVGMVSLDYEIKLWLDDDPAYAN